MRKKTKNDLVRNNGLSIVLLFLFLLTICGQFVTGFHAYNDERAEKQLPQVSAYAYACSGHFISSVGENWESEFLQMAVFVWLTAFLFQRGSAESNKLPEEKTQDDIRKEEVEEKYCNERRKKNTGWIFYEWSLTIALLFLFLVSFVIHSLGSFHLVNEERIENGLLPISFWGIFKENEFWFESFQNWQSEFLSVAMIVVLSIFLRHRGSAQSKKMNQANHETGD